MSISFKEFIGAHPEETVRLGDMVNATVVGIDRNFIHVDGGSAFKSESRIALEEFVDHNPFATATAASEEAASLSEPTDRENALAVGDKVAVVVEALDNGLGEAVLSREKAKRGLAWSVLQEALDNKTTVPGIITGKVRGGFTVDLGVLKGFLPGSLVDAQYLEEINALSNQVFDFQVITLDYQRNNIVLSQGQVTRDALLEKLKEGQVVKGYVKNIADYGAFINLGGIDGLLHNSDIGWEKTTAREKFKDRDPKEPLEVMILKIDQTQERPRISLGLKQLSEDPWVNLMARYSVGMYLEKRRVTHIKEYGCFVEIERGVEGLVHISEMDWTARNPNPYTVIQNLQDEEGRIDVVILGMEVDLAVNKRRLSLGIKQCVQNPWLSFAESHHEGDQIQGTIRSITDLGLFIQLPGNIDGLVHHSELNTNSSEEMNKQFSKGDTVEVVILSIDPNKERIALSMRQVDSPDSDPQSGQPVVAPEATVDEMTELSDDSNISDAVMDIADEVISDPSNKLLDETVFDESNAHDNVETTVLEESSDLNDAISNAIVEDELPDMEEDEENEELNTEEESDDGESNSK